MNQLRELTNEEFRKVQLEELDILKEVKRVCDENNIDYFLDYGTLLGAVRHKGFIPWDNDIDISMTRDNYDRFCAIANDKLRDAYFLQTWETDQSWPLCYAKVRKKNTIFVTNYVEPEEQGDLVGFDIDIFPYDYAPAGNGEMTKLCHKLAGIQRLILMKNGFRPWYFFEKFSVVKYLLYIPYRIKAFFYSRESLVERYEEFIRQQPSNETLYAQVGTNDLYMCNKRDVSELTTMSYEGIEFKCPKNFDSLLTMEYGEYMKLPSEKDQKVRAYVRKISFSQ